MGGIIFSDVVRASGCSCIWVIGHLNSRNWSHEECTDGVCLVMPQHNMPQCLALAQLMGLWMDQKIRPLSPTNGGTLGRSSTDGCIGEWVDKQGNHL